MDGHSGVVGRVAPQAGGEKKGHVLPDALWVWSGFPGMARSPPALGWQGVPQVHVHLEPREGTSFEKRVTADITEVWIQEITLDSVGAPKSSDTSF